MVMPRAFSSGEESISSYFLAAPPNFFDRMVVIAAVKVVLPWSTCPMVPTFTCGLVRSNFSLAISSTPQNFPQERCGPSQPDTDNRFSTLQTLARRLYQAT